MDQFVPFFFFFVVISLVYAIKVVVDARTRNKLIGSSRSDELIHMVLAHERTLRRGAALRSGVLLSCLAGAFWVIEVVGWRGVTPGAIGVLLGATGIGNLVLFAIERSLSRDERDDSSPTKST